jgi:hypothetical protein
MSFPFELFLAAALVVTAMISGRLVVGLAGARLLLRFTPTNAAASTILGAMVWTVGYGWLTQVGWPAPRIAAWLGAAHVGAFAACAWRKKLAVGQPHGPIGAWLLLLAAFAAAAVVSLLPVLRTNGFAIENDTFLYCAFADWLQREGFSTPCRFVPDSPLTFVPSLWQSAHATYGATYPLALLESVSSARTSLIVFPGVTALAGVLIVAAVVLVARWVLRLTSARACVAGVAFALIPGPICWGYRNGFLQQTFGLAGLLFAIALLTRCVHRPNWSASSAFLLALTAAYVVSVYMAIVPALGIAMLVFVIASYRRARLKGEQARWLFSIVGLTGLVAALANHDLRVLVRGLPLMVSGAPGWHIPFTRLDFLEFAVGARLYAGRATTGAGLAQGVQAASAPVYLALVLLGVAGAARRSRCSIVLAVLALLAGSLALFAFVIRDPWTGEIGHTWSVFKLTQWAFPLVFLLQAYAADRLVRARRAAGTLILVGLAVLAASWVRIQWVWSRELGLTMRNVIRSERPLEELPGLKDRVQSLPRGTLLVLGHGSYEDVWLRYYTALFAYPRRVMIDWTGSPSRFPQLAWRDRMNTYLERVQDMRREQLVPIIPGFVPFTPEGVEDLGGGFARLKEPRPLVLQVRNRNGLEFDPRTGQPFFWMGQGRTEIVLFSPTRRSVQLVLAVRPGPSKPETGRRTVEVHPPSEPARVLGLENDTEWRVPLTLRSPLTTVGFEVRDRPSVSSVRGDARPLLLGVMGLRIDAEGVAASWRKP